MVFAMPQILGLSPHSYYHGPRGGVLHPDNGLVSGMASCQRLGLSSSLPNQDARFQQQSPAIVYSRGGKSLSGSPGLYQQQTIPDPHRSVLVHTGSPAQSGGGGGSMSQHSSIIQFSPTNHQHQHQLLRAGDPQPDPQQQIIYCDGYSPQAATSHSPTPPQAQAAQHYPTVIQQQQKSRAPPGEGQRRVTVKEENLDQAYLDDGECKLLLFYSE